MLFWETHDLVWEIISVSEKRMKNCIVKIIDNVLEKNDEGGLFPLKGKNQRIITSDHPPSQCLGKCAAGKYLTRAPLGEGLFRAPLSFSCDIF